MVYTSGTTGQPKGAMLSHQYILNSCESLRQTIPIFDTDVSFSYLPGCHVAERISGIYNRLHNGASVYFVDDLTKPYAYMLEVKPTVFASLPRFFEKIHAKVVSENGAEVDSQTLKDAFGGRIRLATSGGAPLPNEIAEFFCGGGFADSSGLRFDGKHLRRVQSSRRFQIRDSRQTNADVRGKNCRRRRNFG